MLEHSPYPPDLAHYFCLFPKIKSVLKGTHFVSVENVKAKAAEILNGGTALNSGSIICSRVSTQNGTILKVIIVDFLNLLNRKSYIHCLGFFVSDNILHNKLSHKTGETVIFFTLKVPDTGTLHNYKNLHSCTLWL